MIFGIAVHGPPYGSEASASALRFARAAVSAGHRIHRVFFYHEGVHTASGLTVPPQDEPPTQAEWVDLARDHQVELAVCIAAALKRGLVNEAEQNRYDLAAASLHPAFTLVGLGQLIDTVVCSDRFLTFAA
jgi:tRNA 2-thiouridine synthesizing protein D